VQAWHWFDAQVAATEAARVLRPGGLLSMGWHVADENVPLIADLASALRTTDGFGQHSDDIPGALAGFGDQEQCELRYDATMPAHELAAMAATWSYVALAPDRAAILDRIAVVADTHADAAGSVTVPYRTFCYRYRRA
jgi:SAM-dependent methyltransferase